MTESNVVERVLVAGDTHANADWFDELFMIASDLGCDRILQLGDFGYWPHTDRGRAFLDHVSTTSEELELPVYWIDGNHENHDLLDFRLEGPVTVDGFARVAPGCFWIPRGTRWEWSSCRFGALGGAHSIDHAWRVPGESWWPQEQLSGADIYRLGDLPLDVLVAHDIPDWVPIEAKSISVEEDRQSMVTRALLSKAIEATQPSLVLAGHWHRRKTHHQGNCTVEVYASDAEGDESSWGVLALDGIGGWGLIPSQLAHLDGHGLN